MFYKIVEKDSRTGKVTDVRFVSDTKNEIMSAEEFSNVAAGSAMAEIKDKIVGAPVRAIRQISSFILKL